MVAPDPASAPASPPPGKPPSGRFGRLLGRPRLSTLLLAVNLILLIAPLSGVFAMRLYESALLRQTESALLSQTAFIAASYRAALERNRTSSLDGGGLSHPVDPAFAVDTSKGEPWRPRPPVLDLARDKPLPPAPVPRCGGPGSPKCPGPPPKGPRILSYTQRIYKMLGELQVKINLVIERLRYWQTGSAGWISHTWLLHYGLLSDLGMLHLCEPSLRL